MAEHDDSNVENLAKVVNSLTEANKALRKVIERGANEVGQLERFEDKFRDTRDKFRHFTEFVQKNNRQTELLKARLDQDINLHRQSADSLRRQIEILRRAIDERASENDKLHHEYKINIEKLHELRKNSDQSSVVKANSSQLFLQRLQNELE